MMALGRVGRTLFRTDTSVSTDSSSNLTSTLGASTPNLKSPCNILQHFNGDLIAMASENDGFDLQSALLLVIATSLHGKSGSGHSHSHVRNREEAASSTSAGEVHAAFISFIRGGQTASNAEDILPLIMPFRARK